MRKIIIPLLAATALMGCASNGAISVGSVTLTPAQTAHIDYTVTTAILNDAAAVAAMPGVSAAQKAAIKAGGAVLTATVETQLAGLMLPGASVQGQAIGAAEAAVSSAVVNVGNAVTAAKGGVGKATPAEIAATAGLAEVKNLPAFLAVIGEIQAGYQPTAGDLATDKAMLDAAAATMAAE